MKNVNQKPFGGVIVAPNHHTEAVVALLTHHVRDRFNLAYYPHANGIDARRQHHFFVVFSVGDLEAVARRFSGNGAAAPVIIHVDEPAMLEQVDYKNFFPGMEVIPLAQADLTAQPDITLRLDLFRRVIETIEARVKEPGANQQ